jgi:flagellar hook-associated protein 3 FlgL
LTQVTTQLQSLRDIALEANAGTVSTANLTALAAQAQQIQTSLLALGNTQDGNGNYIFAGFASQTQPFSAAAAGATYSGDQGQQQVQIAAGQTVAAGDNGGTVFGGSGFNSIKTGNGTFTVAAGTANAGSGVLGAATVSPTSIAAGGSTTYAGGTYKITFTSPTDYSIADTTTAVPPVTTTTAYTNFAPGGTITYGGVQVAITGQPASVAAAASNTGTGVLGNAVLANSNTYAGDAYKITFTSSTDYSIADTTTAVPPVTTTTAYTNFTPGGTITLGSVNVPMTGQPANGDSFNVALDSFTVAPSTNQSIFATVQGLITAMQAGTGTATSATQLSNSIAGSLSNIDQALNNVSTLQSSVGGRLSSIATQFSFATSQQLQLQTSIASLQGVNYAAAVSSLAAQNTTLTAAMQAYTLTQGLSLFKYIS